MKLFEPFEIDSKKCKSELASLRAMLAEYEKGVLKEREGIL